MTPLKGKTWPYFEIDQNNKAGMIESWRVSLFMNPFISQAEKDEIIELYGVDEIDRRVYGLFALLTGAVFKEFDEQVHILREEPRISPSWRRIRAVDLGYENPFCCLWIAQDDTGCLWVYDEYYQSHKLVRDHVPVIDSITQQHLQNVFHGNVQNYRPIECNLSDHEAQTRAELSAEGFHSRPAVKDIELGVQTVNRYLKPHAGKANLYISPRCRNLIRQMGTYHYKDVKEGKENKEVIDKVDDHAVDALRYGVMFFARPPRDYTVRQ
jgi:phage terminase large subunit